MPRRLIRDGRLLPRVVGRGDDRIADPRRWGRAAARRRAWLLRGIALWRSALRRAVVLREAAERWWRSLAAAAREHARVLTRVAWWLVRGVRDMEAFLLII